MNIVLLSGGSEKDCGRYQMIYVQSSLLRFSKGVDGCYESMVQRVYRQIKEVDTNANVTIATSKKQVSILHNQLGDCIGICDRTMQEILFRQ